MDRNRTHCGNNRQRGSSRCASTRDLIRCHSPKVSRSNHRAVSQRARRCDLRIERRHAGDRRRADAEGSAHKTVSTAELHRRIAGGYLTDVSGSSSYISYGWVTYSNAAKCSRLGVEAKLIEHHGAVSEAVAGAMAEGALKVSASDIGVGISGIAGPDGGTESEPVGTVCIALAAKNSPTIPAPSSSPATAK